MTEFWTVERIDKLFAMVSEGHTFSSIGAVLGCSRNACTGKYNRIRVARGIYTRKPRPKIITTERAPPSKPKVAPRAAMPVMHIVAQPVQAECNSGVSIVDVVGCRYAVVDDPGLVGGMAFCNHPVEGHGSYCADHARIVYTKPPKPGAVKRFTMPTSLLRAGMR